MIASLATKRVDFGSPEVRGNLTPPKEIKFELDTKAKEYTKEAENHFDELIGKHELKVYYHKQSKRPLF